MQNALKAMLFSTYSNSIAVYICKTVIKLRCSLLNNVESDMEWVKTSLKKLDQANASTTLNLLKLIKHFLMLGELFGSKTHVNPVATFIENEEGLQILKDLQTTHEEKSQVGLELAYIIEYYF